MCSLPLIKKLSLELSLYTFLDILSTSPFEEVDILQIFTINGLKNDITQISNQLILFE